MGCGKCTSSARRELDDVKNTERSMDIEFDGMMFDISFQQRISDAIQRREEHGEKSIRGQKAEESLERRKLQFDWEHTPEYWEDDSGTPCTSHSDCMDFCNWDGTCAACGEFVFPMVNLFVMVNQMVIVGVILRVCRVEIAVMILCLCVQVPNL